MTSSKRSTATATATAILAILATSSVPSSRTQAFQPSSLATSPTRNNNIIISAGSNARGIKPTLKMVEGNGEELSEVEKLRAAAAKAREEYERLSKVSSAKFRCTLEQT